VLDVYGTGHFSQPVKFDSAVSFPAGQTFPGTVTSVGISAPSGDFAVTGSPVTGSGTLALNWGSNPPTASNTINAIVRRDGTGSFAGNAVYANTINASAVSAADVTLTDGLYVHTARQIGIAAVTTGAALGATGVSGSAPVANQVFGVAGVSGSYLGPMQYPAGVIGTTSSTSFGFGVIGVSSGSSSLMNGGVYGLSDSSNGMGLMGWVTQPGATAAVLRNTGGGQLISAEGSNGTAFTVGNDGTVKARGPIIGSAGAGTPVAFASVGFAGDVQSSTSNVTVNYNSSTGRYEITIAGVSFDRSKYTTIATPSGWSGVISFLDTDDNANGKLLVDCRDASGTLHQCDFQVVVFQSGPNPLTAAGKEKALPNEDGLTPTRLPISN